METETQYLLHLLGAFLREESPEPPPTGDWDSLIELARIHNVLGILGYMGMQYPICEDPRIKRTLRGHCMNTVIQGTQRYALAQQLEACLLREKIDHILMKGYVLRELYPVPELRTFNDIDIVIRPEDRNRSHKLMGALGYRTHTDWEPVYSYFRDQELYELHTEILDTEVSDRVDCRSYFAGLWKHVYPISENGYRFTPEYHFLYLMIHLAKHIHGSGAGIRMYLDLAAFVKRYTEKLDWDWFIKQLKQLNLFDFGCAAMTAVECWFGIAVPAAFRRLPASVMEDFLDFTMEAGIFGHHNREAAMAELKRVQDGTSVSRIRQILTMTFPSAGKIQARYTYLQDKPWLLPAAWVHRLVKNRDRFGNRTLEIKQIISADKEEVRRLQKLMRSIGL